MCQSAYPRPTRKQCLTYGRPKETRSSPWHRGWAASSSVPGVPFSALYCASGPILSPPSVLSPFPYCRYCLFSPSSSRKVLFTRCKLSFSPHSPLPSFPLPLTSTLGATSSYWRGLVHHTKRLITTAILNLIPTSTLNEGLMRDVSSTV